MKSLLVKVSAVVVLIPIIMFVGKEVDGAVFSHYGAERVERPKSIVLADIKDTQIDNRQSTVTKHLRADIVSDAHLNDPAPELRGFAAPDEIIFEDRFTAEPISDVSEPKKPAKPINGVADEEAAIPALRL